MISFDPTERKAYRIGLEYAWLVERHFPEFYIRYVAPLQVRFQTLYQISHAFLALAHTKLLALDGLPSDVKATSPQSAFAYGWADETGRRRLVEDMVFWLSHPTPRVYGFGGAEAFRRRPISTVWRGNQRLDQYGPMPNPLGLALLRLVNETPWAVLTEPACQEIGKEFTGMLCTALTSEICAPLPPQTPMVALCAHLDHRPGGMTNLGTMLAYVCARTGNVYANHFQEEVNAHDDQIVDLDWRRSTAAFTEERKQQQQAGKWASRYRKLNNQAADDPALLLRIVHAIRAAAESLPARPGLAGAEYRPGTLHTLALLEDMR